MDKLRALQYFVAAAEEHSFTRAARRLEVSVPAIVRLVNTLEHALKATLFERSVHGTELTAAGERYLEACKPVLLQLAAADQVIAAERHHTRGSLVIGAHPELASLPWLREFHAAYPDVQIDLRIVSRPTISKTPADAYLVHGWPAELDMVRRVVAQPRLLTCAAPAYWARNGVPARPEDLESHACLLYCNDEGTVNDLWRYQRGTQTVPIAVRGWLVSNSRAVTLEAALAGGGIVRVSDLLVGEQLRAGSLVPALVEWQMTDAPPFNLLYRASQRRNGLLRLLVDFLVTAFGRHQDEHGFGPGERRYVARPYWSQRGVRRASAVRVAASGAKAKQGTSRKAERQRGEK